MSLSLYYRLVGYTTIEVSAEQATELLELCRACGYPYAALAHTAKGIRMAVPNPHAQSLLRDADARRLSVKACRQGGCPRLFARLWRRPGLLLGMILGVLLFGAGSSIIWDIRVQGNTTVSDHAIRETLSSVGLQVGTPIRTWHADVTANRALLADERLAWLSINRRGTVAYVEVREAVSVPEEPSDAPADIVATVGGVIERVEVIAGNVRVHAGQSVSEGQVLVSGLWDSEVYGLRYTRACARVYARTHRTITVSIPYEYEQKVYPEPSEGKQEPIYQDKFLNFFGKSIKFSKKGGNPVGVCDIIESERSIIPFSSVGFPLSVKQVWYLPYEYHTATRTYAEAEELAYLALSKRIRELPGGAELLQKTIKTTRTDSAYILTCELVCVENIGTVREILINRE